MGRPLVLVLVLLLAAGAELPAQVRDDPQSLTIRPRQGSGSDDSPLSDAAQAELEREATSTWGRIGRHAAFTLGFGLVGSGMGYFASQVAYSDWDKINDSTFSRERWNFSLTGAAIGAVSGFVLGMREGSRAPLDSRLALRQELAGTNTLPGVELERSAATNAYDAVRALRPGWLIVRGLKIGETGTGASDGRNVMVVPGATTIRVYLDNAFLGDLDSLRNIPIGTIRSIQRLDAAQATVRWGAGHTHGAILVETIAGG